MDLRRRRLLTFVVLWGVFGAIVLMVWVPAVLVLDHFVNSRPDRPRLPFLHAMAVPVWTVIGWIFLAGAFGLLFYLTGALAVGVTGMWRRALFGHSTTGTALRVSRVREETEEETAIDRVDVSYLDEAGAERQVTVDVIAPRKPIVAGGAVPLRYPRGRPDRADHSTPISDTVLMIVMTAVWVFLAVSSVSVIWYLLNYYLHLTG